MKMDFKTIYKKLWPWLVITFGAITASLGYVLFILPMNMVEGGVTGIGIIIRHLTGLPIVGISSLIITGIVFIIAARILGKGFGAKSIYAAVISNLLIDFFMILKLPKITDDILLSAFYGGVVVGLGLGLVYFSGASTGGADALAQILWKLKKYRIGKTLIIIDLFVLSAAIIIFIPLEKIMYSMIFIYVEISVIDKVLNGVQANQRIMIITDKPNEMKKAMFTGINRGITIFTVEGGYTGRKRHMLTSVVPKKDIPELKRIVATVDDKSFVVVHNVHQVYGEGFEPLPLKRKTTT